MIESRKARDAANTAEKVRKGEEKAERERKRALRGVTQVVPPPMLGEKILRENLRLDHAVRPREPLLQQTTSRR